MINVWVYNPYSKLIEKYQRELDEPMPYVMGNSLLVREFRGKSKSSLVWTDLRFLEVWNGFRSYYGKPIPVGYAFRRIWENGHGKQSQHYAGGAFDVGQVLSSEQRKEIHKSAQNYGKWSYVEPLSMTPTWVHLDKRLAPPACPRGGYIKLKLGDRGVYVLILQDALAAVGYPLGGLDGYFGGNTKRAVMDFQRENGLAVDGIMGCKTWTKLTTLANGIGLTKTVINP